MFKTGNQSQILELVESINSTVFLTAPENSDQNQKKGIQHLRVIKNKIGKTKILFYFLK